MTILERSWFWICWEAAEGRGTGGGGSGGGGGGEVTESGEARLEAEGEGEGVGPKAARQTVVEGPGISSPPPVTWKGISMDEDDWDWSGVPAGEERSELESSSLR